VPVWQSSWCGELPNLRGVNTILVDPFKCSVREAHYFDTWAELNSANQLRDYLQQVNRGSIIVGVSADEPSRFLASALPTLRELGADVANVEIWGSFGFVAQKGFPAKTVLRKVLTQVDSYTNPPHFNVTVTGTFYCRTLHSDSSHTCVTSTNSLLWAHGSRTVRHSNPLLQSRGVYGNGSSHGNGNWLLITMGMGMGTQQHESRNGCVPESKRQLCAFFKTFGKSRLKILKIVMQFSRHICMLGKYFLDQSITNLQYFDNMKLKLR